MSNAAVIIRDLLRKDEIDVKTAVSTMLSSQVEILDRLSDLEQERDAWKNRLFGYFLASLTGGGLAATVIKVLL